MTQDRAVVTI